MSESLFNKVARLQTFLYQKETPTKAFSCEISEILRASFHSTLCTFVKMYSITQISFSDLNAVMKTVKENVVPFKQYNQW